MNTNTNTNTNTHTEIILTLTLTPILTLTLTRTQTRTPSYYCRTKCLAGIQYLPWGELEGIVGPQGAKTLHTGEDYKHAQIN